ncbi:MAG: universal stress protein [Pseudohongiellaceae bacterium]
MYKKILVAVDLSNDTQTVIDTAAELAGDSASMHPCAWLSRSRRLQHGYLCGKHQ